MERDQVLYAVIGIGFGLILGWLFWRFKALGRAASVALQNRLESAERRLSRSEEGRGDAEARIGELEQALDDERKVLDGVLAASGESTLDSLSDVPDVAGLSHLATDQERVHTLAERLAQSQAWLEESEARVAELEAIAAADGRVQALTSELADRDNAIAATKQSIQVIKQQVIEAGNSLEGVIDLRADDTEASMSTSQLLSLRQAEVTALRRKVETIEGDVDEKSEVLHQRQSELVAQLEQAQAELDAVGDAPERAVQLQDEVARLRAQVADHSIERDRLSSQLDQRDAIDNKLDSLFVEIHELRGRSAALRSGIRQQQSAKDNNH